MGARRRTGDSGAARSVPRVEHKTVWLLDKSDERVALVSDVRINAKDNFETTQKGICAAALYASSSPR